MKFSLIFALFSLATLTLANDVEDDEKIFQSYIERFNIRSGRNANIDKIKENVLKNWREIEAHNEKFRRGEESFFADLNENSWKSDDEFRATSLGFIENPKVNDTQTPPPPSRAGRVALPAYWNWVDRGVVRPVQNQGSCGSCYAFAAIGAIEAAGCIYKGQCSKLSEQEAMECTNLCSGGWDDWVYNYSYQKSGCTSSSYSYYPYRRADCSAAQYRSRVSNSRTTGWYGLTGYSAETIREYLYTQGPMFVAFDVYNNFNYYAGGIYSGVSGNYLGGHAVLLVGYGTENGVPYWICKNSWGSGWGERGYFRIRRGINLARIESYRVSVPLLG